MISPKHSALSNQQSALSQHEETSAFDDQRPPQTVRIIVWLTADC
jgi:hypothetical protein